jgi:hypothetical protein
MIRASVMLIVRKMSSKTAGTGKIITINIPTTIKGINTSADFIFPNIPISAAILPLSFKYKLKFYL